jgi:hypothetical protein
MGKTRSPRPGLQTLGQRRIQEATEWARIREEILKNWANGVEARDMKIRAYRHSGYLSPLGIYQKAKRIYQELDVRSPAAAVTEAYRRGYLPCPCSGPVRAADVLRYVPPKATS